jgi:type I site-specific restriction-modification system R (restriction) subunit
MPCFARVRAASCPGISAAASRKVVPRAVRHPAMQSPTLVVLTDHNVLDDRFFGQFQSCADILLGQTSVQANGREHLHELRLPDDVAVTR